jgi:hypothetical protein
MEDRRVFDNWREGQHFYFDDVYLEGGALELETGEVLSAPFARLNDSTISASLRFLAEEEGAKSEMQYWPQIEADNSAIGPFIVFDIFASVSDFGELVTNIRNGLVPERICVKLAEDHKFWRSADPTNRWSKKVWRNEIDNAHGCAAIPIEGYAFSYVIKDERLK